MPVGLFPQETRDLLAGDTEGTSAPPTPDFTAGSLTAPFTGMRTGLTKLGESALTGITSVVTDNFLAPMHERAIQLANTGVPVPAGASVIEMDPDDVKREQAVNAAKVVQDTMPNPHLVGTAGQILHGLSSGLTQFVGGTLLAGGDPIGGAVAVGAGEGTSTRNELIAAGVDTPTADALGAGAGLFAGAASGLPGGFGPTLASRIASGAAAQTALGIANRGMMSKVLTDAGYTDQARAYAPLDGMSIMADAVLGAGFGLMHHAFAPSTVDAARVVKDAEQVERAAPGVPVDAASRTNTVDAVNSHTESLIRGDDNPPPVGDVRTVPDAVQERADEAARTDLADAAAEAGAGRVEAPAEPETMPVELPEGTDTGTAGSLLGRAARNAEREKAQGEQVAQLDPDVQESVTQAQSALRDDPDRLIPQVDDDGNATMVSAREALQKAMDDVGVAADEGRWHQIAAACFGRA